MPTLGEETHRPVHEGEKHESENAVRHSTCGARLPDRCSREKEMSRASGA
jgi:hypothetical protein